MPVCPFRCRQADVCTESRVGLGRKTEKTAERRRKMRANVDKEAGIQIKTDKQVPAGSRVCCLA